MPENQNAESSSQSSEPVATGPNVVFSKPEPSIMKKSLDTQSNQETRLGNED